MPQPTALLASADTNIGVPWAEVPNQRNRPRVVAITTAGHGTLDWSTLFDTDSSPLPPAADGDGSMDIMYTSGTTGAPKAVVVRHPDPNPADRPAGWNGLGFMTSSPFSTTSGALLVYGPMRGGLSGWYQPRFDPGQWLSLVELHRPVAAFVVPAMAQLIVAHPNFERADLSSLAALTIGGAPITRATLRRLGERLPQSDILVGYGLTEFGAVSRSPSGDQRPPPGLGGSAAPGGGDPDRGRQRGRTGPGAGGRDHRAGCRSANGSTTKPRPTPSNPGGKDGSTAATSAISTTTDSSGSPAGPRTLIIRGGHNISPGEVEEVLYAHPDVVEAVVAGIPHDVLGEDVGAWVVLSEGSDTTATDLRAFLLERLADYKVPRQLRIIDRLPRNASGKVIKGELEHDAIPPPASPEAEPVSADNPTVLTERIGAVCRLTLNRPERHNPLTPRCIRELLEAVADAERDAGIRVVVIRGSGRSFSSGYGILPEDIEPGDADPPRGIEGDAAAMLELAAGWAKVWDCRHPGHRPGARQLPGRRHRSRPPLRHRGGRRRRPHRVPPGPVDGGAAHQHVALPSRSAVDQAVAVHRRHGERRRGRRHRPGAGRGARGPSSTTTRSPWPPASGWSDGICSPPTSGWSTKGSS